MTAITLTLNGDRVREEVEPRDILADLLRDRLRLTGTHLGCEHGACGACTVTLDGLPVRSCIVLAVMCDGRTVETIEGTRADATMDVIRRHFHEQHALQCGFCTPGMLIAARDIIARHTRPDEATVRRELSGQVCRCTGYMGIVAAIRAAAAELHPAPGADLRTPDLSTS
ncbi:(2Fe-2S)-binding protein [Aquabacter spiritensis]|uniref:Aerobic-type carbon monoxide dehydrogenase small subunit (CoxS/CutS family) n=1 Tax=Aquabacter spiritensis TaxID=933073 RepID=A0A4R3M3B5_9HYPH|nr:(2Fe-2S)-binding protein [Aquabacter spiritensis]TCT06719.1 aerobic-type carbon monoxide dehydrogenase small subunit (CoxS/CutS family) [Aquabacter spiritensis]